jgi:hypothetical protein
VLFYYHEGDNPHKIKQRLDQLCAINQLPAHCFLLVTGNDASYRMNNSCYFPDHELLYQRKNNESPASSIHNNIRTRDFTVLSRTHKWWRSTVMTDLYRNGLLANSYWSYRDDVTLNESRRDNPIQTLELNIDYAMDQFLKGCPYTCDNLTADEHNDHSIVNQEHYTNSYCNIVLETLYDADRSKGTFLSEKTFKAIKHGQPFIIVGPAGSLARLRELGYRTFEHAIDDSYDAEEDNTQRWIKIFQAICKIKNQDMHKWFESCREDVEHNQRLFLESKYKRLNILFQILKFSNLKKND